MKSGSNRHALEGMKIFSAQEGYLKYYKRKEGNCWHTYKRSATAVIPRVVSEYTAFRTHLQKQNSKHPNSLFGAHNRFCKVLQTNLLNTSLLPCFCINGENITNLANEFKKNINKMTNQNKLPPQVTTFT